MSLVSCGQIRNLELRGSPRPNEYDRDAPPPTCRQWRR